MGPNGTVQCCVNQDTMEQSTITCLWDIIAFSLSIIQPAQHMFHIYSHISTQPVVEAQPPRSINIDKTKDNITVNIHNHT